MHAPFFSIIIPLNKKRSYLFPFTLDSLTPQKKEASFEVIIVDGTEGQLTLDHLPIQGATVLRAEKRAAPAMLNQALKVAKGEYIHVLLPGEFYAWNHALTFLTKMIRGHGCPDLIYSPQRQRHHFGQPTVDLQPLTLRNLKQGEISVSMQSYWIRRETLVVIGGFNESLPIQYGYDLICRLFLIPTIRKKFMKRILTDYEYRRDPPEQIWRQSVETARVSFKHFGLTRYLFLWVLQNCLRLFQFSWKMVRLSFWKKHATV